MNERGAGVEFGPDITCEFLEANQLTLLIRSHECKQEGHSTDHDGRCVTVFSASNYCGVVGNRGAICVISPDKSYKFVTYEAPPLLDTGRQCVESLENTGAVSSLSFSGIFLGYSLDVSWICLGFVCDLSVICLGF